MLDQDSVDRASEKAETDFDDACAAVGICSEKLSNPTGGKAPDRLLLADGSPVGLAEVKYLASGGWEPTQGFHHSLHDAAFPLDGKARSMPAIPRQLDDKIREASGQRKGYVRDVPEHERLPFCVVLDFDLVAHSLAFDHRRPAERDVSGIMMRAVGRRQRDAFMALSQEERDRRLETLDMSGLPDDEEVELLFYPNPYTRRPLCEAFRARVVVIQPGGLDWPDHLSEETEEGAAADWKAVASEERAVLKSVYEGFGRVKPQLRHLYDAVPDVIDRLIARGLAADNAGSLALTNRGLTVGLAASARDWAQ